jgi:hypothetical protein
MNKKTSEEYNMESDKYLRETGPQGGKIIAEKLVLGCFIMGIPFLIIGLLALFNMLFGLGFPTNTAIIILTLIITAMGLLLTFAGYTIYRTKHVKN